MLENAYQYFYPASEKSIPTTVVNGSDLQVDGYWFEAH